MKEKLNISMHKKFQRKLFWEIKARDPDCREKIKSLLGICNSAYYKRVRGDTEMRIGEVMTICQAYNINSIQII